MAILPILTYPDPRLKMKSHPIEKVDAGIRTLMTDMYETMVANDGCGLAAPQVGVHKRVIVIDFSYRDPEFQPVFMANPEILWTSSETMALNEGCLSVPEGRGLVTRSNKIRVRYLDRDNIQQEHDVEELFAYAIQHEIDHLEGILYIDRLSPLRRQIVLSKMRKKR